MFVAILDLFNSQSSLTLWIYQASLQSTMPYYAFPRTPPTHHGNAGEPTTPPSSPPSSLPSSPPLWSSPAVDRFICALDLNGIGTFEIVRRVKRQFPNLKTFVITVGMVERRLAMLDQNIAVDYFSDAVDLTSSNLDATLGETRGVNHGPKIQGAVLSQRISNPKAEGHLKPKSDEELQELLIKAEQAIANKSSPRTESLRDLKKSKSVHFATPPRVENENDVDPIRNIMNSPLLLGSSKGRATD